MGPRVWPRLGSMDMSAEGLCPIEGIFLCYVISLCPDIYKVGSLPDMEMPKAIKSLYSPTCQCMSR